MKIKKKLKVSMAPSSIVMPYKERAPGYRALTNKYKADYPAKAGNHGGRCRHLHKLFKKKYVRVNSLSRLMFR